MDALEAIDRLLKGEGLTFSNGETLYLSDFSAFHASPPCQGNSDCVNPTLGVAGKLKHKDLITPTREMLNRTGKLFVMENVPGAPLENYYKLDGTQFGLKTIKERWFETHGFELPLLMITPFNANGLVKAGKFAGIMRHGKDSGELTKREHLATAYEIDWGMNRKELRLAIPPVFMEYIGKYLMQGVTGYTPAQ